MLDRIGGNIRVGHSDLFLTEACEYTNSFLEFYPLYSIILNVEEDHMDFFKDIEDIKNSFHKFASQTADDGLIIINGDMEHTDFILNGLAQKHVTFGLNPKTITLQRILHLIKKEMLPITLLHMASQRVVSH